MHLSKTNNREEVALETARDALAGRRVRLTAAPADGVMVLDTAAGPPEAALPMRQRPPAQAARGAADRAFGAGAADRASSAGVKGKGQAQGRRGAESPPVDVRQLDLPFLS
jgi:hypothetical protein